MPLVSVVMPSYNHEKFVSETIESVLGQDFDDLELIIVDDASTDASRQIIQKYAAEDARVRVILHETNCGISKTMNDGIEIAQGKFLAWTASDDVWMKDKLSKQLAVLESNEDLIVWTDGELIDEGGQRIQRMGPTFSAWSGAEKKSGDIFRALSARNYICPPTPLFKRENMGSIRYDERLKYSNDWKVLLDLAKKYEFHFIPEPLAQYRIHANNTLAHTGPRNEAHRVESREIITIIEGTLSEWPHRNSAEAKANALVTLGLNYYNLGQNRKALMSYFRAFTSAPFRRSNLQYPRRFFRFTRSMLRRRIVERK